MAKSTKAQQISTGTPDSYTAEELADPYAALRARPMLGGELKLAGTNSSPSSKSEPTSNDSSKPNHLPPAPMTESLSGQQAKEANSTAVSTVGDGPTAEELSPSDSEIVKPATAADKKARVRSADMDDPDFAALQ